MYSITDLKKDTLIQLDGQPFKVIDYMQKQMGRGGSIVNVKLKNLVNGSVLDKTFKGNEKIEAADIERFKVQFLYPEGTKLNFMNTKTYDQFTVEKELIGSSAQFLTEGLECDSISFNGNPISVELPIKIDVKVSSAPDVVRGDTQSTVMKTVELENGSEIQTPIFIKTGDTIVVDTRDGSYVERKKD